jgi:hypothetical protein
VIDMVDSQSNEPSELIRGYDSPDDGRADNTAKHTLWVQLRPEGKWYSPKDLSIISKVPRRMTTHMHVTVLKRNYPGMIVCDLKKRRKRKLKPKGQQNVCP